ncbi:MULTISPECIES: FtsW/RodA/SpoVE family cell cycle protein [Brevibacillus]|uniref:FtsW/RodA/SpoVE family cell cycle protein n=1 Tax=Brevibacillus TaxID=55080 RepID=UPI00203DF9AC|nr:MULTISPECIES: FtsW/RodA/SpoVE family cell cycle protein [Brevibacillus]MCM3081502.1 FtsW/RodA/SpoVE family cell cycle protein [Brevibacillus invocatus]MCM3431877.1 FtsW/RodA/SpoVE family cell cycle protein [Brevibacillus invocatus]MDH4619093.1 FtsW/RodA/SpoVE family cell cycle protein [Brevibacillus sp. AY1]
MSRQNRIDEYIQQVCRHIRNKNVHASISLELECHLADKMEDYESQGYDEENAIKQAIADMGDPEQVGKQLHHAHKPRMEWSIIAIVAVLIGFGLLVMYSLSGTQSANHLSGWSFFENKVIGTLLGLSLFIAVLFGDYRKLKPYSKHLYLGALLITFLALFQGGTVNGSASYLDLGIIRFDVMGITTLLTIIALAGMFSEWNWESRGTYVKAFAAFTAPFLMILSAPDMQSAFLLFAGFFVLMMTSSAKKKVTFTLFGLITGSIACLAFLFIRPYQTGRIAAFLDPYADPNGAGYMIVQSLKLVQSAGLWGNGFGARVDSLPTVESEFIFTYIVYSFGIVTGSVILLLGIALLIRLLKAVKGVRDSYGFMLMAGLMTLFFIPYFWNILMVVGLMPITSVNLPFISHGNVQFVLQMLLMGLVLNVYRNKDIQPWTDKSILTKNR